MAAVDLISTTAMTADTIACTARPTLSGRGRRSQMEAAATRMAKRRY